MPSPLSKQQYDEKFEVGVKDSPKRKTTLERALDSRKFEIDMYWKRATYFWAFIAAAFAGYVVVQSRTDSESQFLGFLIACVGLVLSFGWLLANRGSKQWQENWENHVDLLEDNEIGPLFKTNMRRQRPREWLDWVDLFVTGPSRHSVSKINQLISLYIFAMWILLVCRGLGSTCVFSRWPTLVITILACLGLLFGGRTYGRDYGHLACLRVAELEEEDDCEKGRLRRWL